MFNPKAFQHLVSVLSRPAMASVLQDKYNKERFKAVENANLVRPHFLPVKIDLPAIGQSMPELGYTDNSLKHDVIIVGAITNANEKFINFYRNSEEVPFVQAEKRGDAKLSISAFAGQHLENSGYPGVLLFTPFLLRPKSSLTVQLYKDPAITDAESYYITFVGYRVYEPIHKESQLSDFDKKAVWDEIKYRPNPEPRYKVVPIRFENGRAENVKTPRDDKPYFIKGFRTDLTRSLITLGFNTDSGFSESPFPIQALCSEKDNPRTNENNLLSPIFVSSQETLNFNITNTINGVETDADGYIELICETV